MISGVILICGAAVFYFAAAYLRAYHIGRIHPGAIGMIIPPGDDGECFGDKTAGLGTVPEWLSLLGFLAVSMFLAGIFLLLCNL